MERLLDLAYEAGFDVQFVSMSAYSGLLFDGLILINSNKARLTQRAALAHELGHAHYGHNKLGAPHSSPKHELQANRYAAGLLIDENAYRQAAMSFPEVRELARELDVPMKLLELWEHEVA